MSKVFNIVVANKGKQLLLSPPQITNEENFSFLSSIFDAELNVSYEELKKYDSLKLSLDEIELVLNKLGEVNNAVCFSGGMIRGDNTAILLNPFFLVVGENFSYQINAQGGFPLSNNS